MTGVRSPYNMWYVWYFSLITGPPCESCIPPFLAPRPADSLFCLCTLFSAVGVVGNLRLNNTPFACGFGTNGEVRTYILHSDEDQNVFFNTDTPPLWVWAQWASCHFPSIVNLAPWRQTKQMGLCLWL